MPDDSNRQLTPEAEQYLQSLMRKSSLGYQVPRPTQWYVPESSDGGAGSGALPGTYNRATGGIPQTPDPVESAKQAIAAASGMMPDFKKLYGQVGSTLIGGDLGALQGAEYRNIADLYGPVPDQSRFSAEAAAGRGIAGAPATDILNMYMSDREKRARVAQASQMFNEAVSRGNAILPTSEWLPSPGVIQGWQDIKNVRGAAPVPSDAFNLNMQAALAGLQRGGSTQAPVTRGGYSPGMGYVAPPTPSPTRTGNYGGAPTLPDYGGGTGEVPPSASWYDPTFSDEQQWNAMFPNDPYVDYPQYNSDIEKWQNSNYNWIPGIYTNPATDNPFDYTPIA